MTRLIVRASPRVAAGTEVEMVERKGLGHPDTMCDAVAEALSVALCRFYLEHFGLVLHHNVDKVLLWGGASRPAFRGGEIIEPMEIFLAGRATMDVDGVRVPVEEIARSACRGWIREHFHALDADAHVEVHPLIRPGSSELVRLFMRHQETGVWLANDTSCGVGYAPSSHLEQVTLAVERALNSSASKQAHPQLGQDVKIMGVRQGERLEITVACAMIGKYLADAADYVRSKEIAAQIAREAAAVAGAGELDVAVNAADDLAAGRIYLTVTGTSAEAGDDGQAGRGNRANGLITPYRPMTLESVAGKNPMTHVGKLYNVAAGEIAAALVAEIDGLHGARCALVSRIGAPIDRPHIVDVALETDEGCELRDIEAPARECVSERVAGIPRLWRRVIEGGVSLF